VKTKADSYRRAVRSAACRQWHRAFRNTWTHTYWVRWRVRFHGSKNV